MFIFGELEYGLLSSTTFRKKPDDTPPTILKKLEKEVGRATGISFITIWYSRFLQHCKAGILDISHQSPTFRMTINRDAKNSSIVAYKRST